MNKRVLLVLGVLAILVVSIALSGCLGGNKTTPTTPGTQVTPTTTPGKTNTPTGALVPAVVSGNTITISGVKTDSSDNQNSTSFDLEEGAYLLTFDNTGGYSNWFTASLETDDESGLYLVSLFDSKGSDALVVGGFMTPAGKYHLNVGNGGTYTVTIEKPTSGAAVPLTLTGSKGQSVAKAVTLNPGQVKLNVKHDVGPTGTTSMGLYDLQGNTVASKWTSESTYEEVGEITTAGVYIFSVSFSGNTGGQATVSQ